MNPSFHRASAILVNLVIELSRSRMKEFVCSYPCGVAQIEQTLDHTQQALAIGGRDMTRGDFGAC